MTAIAAKLERYRNPWQELKLQYGANKGKAYTGALLRPCAASCVTELQPVFLFYPAGPAVMLIYSLYRPLQELANQQGAAVASACAEGVPSNGLPVRAIMHRK